MSNDALLLRTVEETDPIDNERGPTYRFKEETGTIDNKRGVTYRVQVVGGGGGATIDPLNVTPSTSAQTITASGGVDGYSPVNVSAVDSSIDANITAANIKKDVSILGVTGTYEGATPTGTMYIISNGTYNVADKAIANVQVPTTAPDAYIPLEINNGVLSRPTSDYTYKVPDGATEILGSASAMNGLMGAFGNSSSAAMGDAHLTGIDFNNVRAIYDSGCKNCCYGCAHLTSIKLDNLEEVYTQGFYESFAFTPVVSVTFTKLSKIDGYRAMGRAFAGSTNAHLTDLYFPAITTTSFTNTNDPFYRMIYQKSGVTLHFPSNVQSVIEGLAGYSVTAPFGATSGSVLFDLPATE